MFILIDVQHLVLARFRVRKEQGETKTIIHEQQRGFNNLPNPWI
jgi:hypothetical protein